MRRFFLFGFICFRSVASVLAEPPGGTAPLDEASAPVSPATASDSGLTWEQVKSRVAADNPVLQSVGLGIEAGKAGVLQAAAFPNPALSAQFENFAGTGPYQGARGLETTVSLNQPFETGGKRKLRREVADQELKLAELDLRSRRAGLLLEAHALFWDILLAQETLLLQAEDRRTAQAFLQVQEARRKAGKSPLLEEQRTRTSLLNGELKRRRVERDAGALRARLAWLMGGDTTAFYRVRGNLDDLGPLPVPDPATQMEGRQSNTKSAQLARLRQSELAIEKAKALPDFELEAGWRHSSDLSAHAVVAGLRLPLPVWDRNRGSILRSRADLERARIESRIAEGRTLALIREDSRRLLALRSDAAFIRDSLLPSATSSFRSAQEGFQLGRFSPLEILDARRTYLEARQTYLETLAEYHGLELDMEKLMTVGSTDGAGSDQEAGK
ncbi:MAG: outer membrane protein TolC [Fibrobacteres bacterium]|nr:outer membrane protein TolC [Fibrobacterota bacterium]